MALAEIPVELVARSREGDPQALNDLIVAISTDLRRLIYNQVRDPEEADEIIQEVLIRVSRHLHNLKDVSKFPSWVMRMTFNQCFTFLRKKSRTSNFYSFEEDIEVAEEQTAFAPSRSHNPRQIMIRREIRREIDDAILELPPRQRAAFSLFQLEGLSIREIADVLGTSEGAVKFNIHQARQKLKKALNHFLDRKSSNVAVDVY
ncbi:RNA polymerase sigma factor [Candidatus Sumerlaeota bacterium]|nr:RNA polymerase sigma factor [Candidatus Sumerlaeota bacterium]